MPTSGRPRIVLLTCVWQRAELTQLVLAYYHSLQRQLRKELDLQLLAVGSEGTHSRGLCEDQGFQYIEHANSPLSHKWNAGVREARALDPDALVIIGSDDLLSNGLLRTYGMKLNQGFDFFGFRDLYFFDLVTARLGYWRGYMNSTDAIGVDSPVGCGRCFSRDLLNKTGWRLWPQRPRVDSFLDLVAFHYLDLLGIRPSIWPLEELGGVAVDIKSETNINQFQNFRYDFLLQDEGAWRFFSANMDGFKIDELINLHHAFGATRARADSNAASRVAMDHKILQGWVQQMRLELGL